MTRRVLALSLLLASCAAGPSGADGGEGSSDVEVFPDPDAGDVRDAGDTIDSGHSNDAGGGLDAGAPTVAGQCRRDSDCGTGDCTESAPGGFCVGCGDDGDCAAGHACSDFGSCNRECTADADCPTGLRCNTTAGACVLKSCGTCPAGTVCSGGFCRRPACDAACVTCVEGSCVD